MNILIVGANAKITKTLLENFGSYEVSVLGRKKPTFIEEFTEARYIEQKYSNPPDINSFLITAEKPVIIFAGIGIEPKLFINLTQAEIDEILSTHTGFCLKIVLAALPKMVEKEFGRFIFLGSSISAFGVVGASMYEISKSAQKGLSRSLAIEYGRFGITSNVIDIGYLEGGYSEKLKESQIKEFKKRIAAPTFLNPNDVVQAIETLIQNASISGSVITIDQAYH